MLDFNRMSNTPKIEVREIKWEGPFSWACYENQNNLDIIPDIEGVYLWTFKYKDGYLVYCAGITNSTKKRFRSHTLEYKSGNYTVFEVSEAERGKRKEIWHGWSYAREHRDEFNERKEVIKRKKKDNYQITFYENELGVLDGNPYETGFYLLTKWT